MFWTSPSQSSVRTTAILRQLVLVILCSWLSGMQDSVSSHPAYQTVSCTEYELTVWYAGAYAPAYQTVSYTEYQVQIIAKIQLFLLMIDLEWTETRRGYKENYENNQQDVPYRLTYYSTSALHASGDVFAHHQENLTIFTVSGSVYPSCCRLVSRMRWNWTHWVETELIRETSRHQLGWTLPDAVNTVKCSWWWAKTSPETCRANLE